MAQNPDPLIEVTTLKGRTRALDDYLTIFHLCLIAIPGRPEARNYVTIGRKALDVFRGADCKTAFLVTGNEHAARRTLGDAADDYVVFVDAERTLVKSLGLERLPAFVHLKADTTLVDAAEGWHPDEWDRVAKGLARDMSWSRPNFGMPGDPPPFAGWGV